jgi:3',5'-cyclic AMP phosphodiesterase CpdA
MARPVRGPRQDEVFLRFAMPCTTPRFAALAVAIASIAHPSLASAAGITKGPWVQRVTPRSALVRVEIDPPGPASVEVAPAGGADAGASAARKVRSPEARDLHSIPVDGLAPGTRYAYTVEGAGGVKSGTFTTAPPEGSTEGFRFLAYGDNRSDAAAHAAVVKAMQAAPGDFLIHTGDFVEDGGQPDDWRRFFDIEAPLLRERCVYSAVGNHELTDGAGIAYARYFGATDPPSATARFAPEHLNGTTRWANARFFFLNSMVPLSRGIDRRWLEKALEDADAEPGLAWRILVMHHGPWSSGPHGNNTMLLSADVPALLRAHNVDLIFAGHDHIYERGINGGLPYVVTGGGGAPTYRVSTALPSARKIESTRHFVQVAVKGEVLALKAVRVDGSTLDTCELAKGRGWTCDAPSPPAASAITSASGTGASGAVPAAPGPTAEGSRCACHAVGAASPPDGGAAGLLSGAATACAVFLGGRRARCARRARRAGLR